MMEGSSLICMKQLLHLKINGGTSSSMVIGLVCRWGFTVLLLPKRGRPENKPDMMKKANLKMALMIKRTT